MKIRVLSSIVMLAIIIPALIFGGAIFNIFLLVVSILAIKEFMDIKSVKKEIPLFIKIISYIFVIMIVGYGISKHNINLQMDYRIITGLFLTFLIPTILYHDKEKYSIDDAFHMIGGIFFLSLSIVLLATVRSSIGLNMLIFVLLITTMTDMYAYWTGMLIGKHKLIEVISPKKTWEGAIGGTLFGVFISTTYYMVVLNPDADVLKIIFITTFLSILGQFGDLVFSAIKRHYGKKDFSNLIPGHGGILDRIDSIIFVMYGFMFFISMI